MLPILSIRDDLLRILRESNRLVLSAPTGSGKTTQVPQFLYHSGAFPRDIVILQPRRLATRLVAERVAHEMNARVGELVGYQTRHDSKISAQTRIRFLTEGLFLRQLQSDPKLSHMSVVILDEFHERNLATDVSLALVKRLQETDRTDLRLIVMSATLDVQQVSTYLACPSLETHGRLYPVDVSYRAPRSTAGSKSAVGKYDNRGPAPVWDTAAEALVDLLHARDEGDVLIFMPGSYEIRRTLESCQRAAPGLDLFPLYSELPPGEQDAALRPSDRRKVIVSTNVAETSITIEGVRHVIDAGLARINRFDPRRGVNVLAIEPISRASADQRAGRAGRTAPGTCVRLWSESDNRHRPAHSDPEIRRLDLAETMLQLLDLGIEHPDRFDWLEAPDPLAAAHALELLEQLGAIEASDEGEERRHGGTDARRHEGSSDEATKRRNDEGKERRHEGTEARRHEGSSDEATKRRSDEGKQRRHEGTEAGRHEGSSGEATERRSDEGKEQRRHEGAEALRHEGGKSDGGYALTDVGARMARLPMHPRLSRMLVEAAGRGCLERACLWAALISDRDILVRGMQSPLAKEVDKSFPRSDFLVLEKAMEFARSVRFDADRCFSKGIHANACREVEKTARLYEQAAKDGSRATKRRSDEATKGRTDRTQARRSAASSAIVDLARCLLVAFPDHLALRRNDTNLAAAIIGGRRGQLDPETIATHQGLLVPVEMREIGHGKAADTKTTLSLVTEIAPEWVTDAWAPLIHREQQLTYNVQTQAVEATDVELLQDIPIGRNLRPDAEVDRGRAAEILAEQIHAGALRLANWDDSVDQWIARVRCVAEWFPERDLLRYDDTEVRVILEELCTGAIRYKDLKDRSVLQAFRNALSWDDQHFVERMAPDRLALPRGWKMRVEYTPGQQPRGRAKIQDFYGLTTTPTVAAGRAKVLLEILAPNMRPIQTTEDLAGFWERLYPELKKSLSRRYPRHEWR